MEQVFVNWVLAGAGTLIGFLLNVVWQAVGDLQRADQLITAKLGEVEVLVAGAYVRKGDLARLSTDVFSKLDRIEDKLDRKADK